jgi:transposase
VSATAILAELGDCRRFASSDDAVRHAGLDITGYQSDDKRAPGHLSHQGPAVLRWALYEAAVSAARVSSPDRSSYLQVAQRLGHNRACLSVARKLCRRAYHLLRELGEEALAPIDQQANEEAIAAAA